MTSNESPTPTAFEDRNSSVSRFDTNLDQSDAIVSKTRTGRSTDSDGRVIEELFRTKSRALHGFVLRQVANREDAQDIVQHAFVEAVRSYDRFRGDSELATWLYGIAINLIRSHLSRKHNRENAPLEGWMVEVYGGETPPLEFTVSKRSEARRIATALDALNEEQRRTLELVAIDGLRYHEAARELGVPIGTVRSRLSRIRSFLKGAIEATTT